MKIKAIKKVVGMHQVDDKVTTHYTWDIRPALAYLLWTAMVIAMLLVAGSCDDNNGMYQGPNDNAPSYGGPR